MVLLCVRLLKFPSLCNLRDRNKVKINSPTHATAWHLGQVRWGLRGQLNLWWQQAAGEVLRAFRSAYSVIT
jgi:hypothetical protein